MKKSMKKELGLAIAYAQEARQVALVLKDPLHATANLDKALADLIAVIEKVLREN